MNNKMFFLFLLTVKLTSFITCLTNIDHKQLIKNELNSEYLWDPIMSDADEYADIIDKNTALRKISEFSETFLFENGFTDSLDDIESYDNYNRRFYGVLWCGSGNNSKDGHTVGRADKTDTCCKHHDYCWRSVSAFRQREITTVWITDPITGETCARYYYKWYWFTVSHCQCDTDFFRCLMDVVNTENSTNINYRSANFYGKIYFNWLNTRCVYSNNGEPYKIIKYKRKFPNNNFEDITPPSNIENECPNQCTNKEPSNCTTPYAGEYREILPHCAQRESLSINGRQTEKCWIDRDKFMALRVCSHPLGEHCAVCKTGCACKYLTKGSEPDVNIYFTDFK